MGPITRIGNFKPLKEKKNNGPFIWIVIEICFGDLTGKTLMQRYFFNLALIKNGRQMQAVSSSFFLSFSAIVDIDAHRNYNIYPVSHLLFPFTQLVSSAVCNAAGDENLHSIKGGGCTPLRGRYTYEYLL